MGLRTTLTAGLLLLAWVAAEDRINSAVKVKEGLTASAQYDLPEHVGADRRGYERDDDDVHDPQAPDEYEDDSADKRYRPDYDDQALKAADPVGQTYLLSTFRRTLSRPASATLRQLAEATPPAYSSPLRNGPGTQGLDSWEDAKAARRHALKRRAHRNTAAPKGQVQAGKLVETRMPGATTSYGSPTAEVLLSFNSLNAFDQRAANAGNQLNIDPPEQALCVGNGYVMAGVNTVVNVYDAATGQPKLVNPLDLCTFFDFPAQYNRSSTPPTYGRFEVWYPSCAYDVDTQRWFFVITSSELTPEADYTGSSSLEIAVSDGPDPTGSWSYFSIPTTNDGTQGTPDFGCNGGFCYPDFPQIAIWKHALVITANVYDAFSFSYFASAAVYAVDKAALTTRAAKANTALVRATTTGTDLLVDTLIPTVQVGKCSTHNSYIVATPQSRLDGWVNSLQLFSLQGTETLASQHARVTLDWVNREVALDIAFTKPPPVAQKPGDIPLGIVRYNITTPNLLGASDARMASVSFVDDKLYCAWGTAVQGEGVNTVAGVAWALLDPHKPKRALTSGLLGATGGNHLLIPHLAVRPGGLGVMALSIAGPDFYPAAAYATLTEDGLGQLTLVAAGVGPLDGFLGYLAADQVDLFGTFAAATVDDNGDFWIASEFSGQTCTPDQFQQPAPIVGVCDKTRAPLVNWYTRITRVAWHPSE